MPANTKLTETQVRAALTRAQTKLARQRQAIAATEAEIAVFEQALKDATAK